MHSYNISGWVACHNRHKEVDIRYQFFLPGGAYWCIRYSFITGNLKYVILFSNGKGFVVDVEGC